MLTDRITSNYVEATPCADDSWAGERLGTTRTITTDASASIKGFHHRMPVILKPEA
jgi:putative SOS response-associated peptidase YedK